jgi:hypothetical protein
LRERAPDSDLDELDARSLEERAAALNQRIAELERRLDEIGEADPDLPDESSGASGKV